MKYKIAQEETYAGNDWWKWSVWVEASEKALDGVEYVQYTLHPTFPNPVRRVDDRASKFSLSANGWGVFTIYVLIHLRDNSEVQLSHELELHYPSGDMPTA
jgi:transcription initiation factor IIF auxiliary subunit